ncbi:MAG: hypothetical protein NUV42_02890 [Candidatus Yonathbacteria bacterium]|nr:hypothetical protein [Candidatus Yonathbacteria bacterium]
MGEKLYATGDVAPESGWYLCVPCGFADEFTSGEMFPVCKVCLAGTEEGPDGYTDAHVDYWQRI